MAPTLAQLIGPLLGAELVYASGVVAVFCDEELDRTERFWYRQRNRWRVERSEGILMVCDGRHSLVTLPSGLREVGPALPPGNVSADLLLHPGHAYVWGRPGEDWRLSDRISHTAGGQVRVELDYVDEPRGTGFLECEWPSGIVWRLQLGEMRYELLELEREPQDEQFERLFVVEPEVGSTASFTDS